MSWSNDCDRIESEGESVLVLDWGNACSSGMEGL